MCDDGLGMFGLHERGGRGGGGVGVGTYRPERL